jgi:glutaredoxin
MKRIVLFFIFLAAMPVGAYAGKLYRWVDPQGKVHYGDLVPVDAVRVEVRQFSDVAIPGEDLSYETRRAQQNFPVTLYVADSCTDPCSDARSLLNKRGVPFTEKNLKTQEDMDAFKVLSGFDTVPVLGIGRALLKGFLAEKWNSELDFAGYPKTPPYRPLVKTPVQTGTPTSAPQTKSQVAPDNTEAVKEENYPPKAGADENAVAQ